MYIYGRFNVSFSGSQVTAFLNQHFQNCSFGQQGPVAWPPMSPHLTSLDYYVLECMKSLVYAVGANTMAKLLNGIMDASHKRND